MGEKERPSAWAEKKPLLCSTLLPSAVPWSRAGREGLGRKGEAKTETYTLRRCLLPFLPQWRRVRRPHPARKIPHAMHPCESTPRCPPVLLRSIEDVCPPACPHRPSARMTGGLLSAASLLQQPCPPLHRCPALPCLVGQLSPLLFCFKRTKLTGGWRHDGRR
jgi:hypothetical protein